MAMLDPIMADDDIPESLQLEVIKAELDAMSTERPDLDTYRSYFSSEQGLVYGSDLFEEFFGEDLAGFYDNWTQVVVDALVDKLKIIGIRVGEGEGTEQAVGDGGDGEDGEVNEQAISESESLSKRIWNTLRLNDFDEQSIDLIEAALVEGKAYTIVWPDPVLGARVDWKPAQQVRVRYADDNNREAIFAINRWVTPSGEIWTTIYTKKAVYKYREAAKESGSQGNSPNDANPTTAGSPYMERRRVEGEPWPLPNPLGVVPVEPWRNKRGSEIKTVIPQQDAINYMLAQMMVAGEFSAMGQRVMLTDTKPPADGWINKPGVVWRLGSVTDLDGKKQMSNIAEFSKAELAGWVNSVGMLLQHVALTSKTPVRYFFKSDRGGRGDAPSGDSLRVEDGPLLDKAEDRQTRFGNSAYRMANLIHLCLVYQDQQGDDPIDPIANRLPPGEVIWRNPESEYRSTLLEQAVKMIAPIENGKGLGIPFEFVVKKIGLTPDEISEVMALKEAQDREQEQKLQDQMDREIETAEASARASAAATTPEPESNGRPSQPATSPSA